DYPQGSRAASDEISTFIRKAMNDDLLSRVQNLKPLAQELDLTLSQLSLAWILQNPNVAATIIGASRPEQVAENVKASGVEIPIEVMAKIDEILGDSIETD